MKRFSIYALSLLMLASSCSREEAARTTVGDADNTLSVKASVNESTKAVTTDGVTTFVNGDKLSLYVWTGDNTAVPTKRVVDGVVNTYDGTKWTPAVQMLWRNIFDAHYFLGIFPSRTVTSFTQDAVTSAEDLLVATILGDGKLAPQNPQKAPVNLVFDHMMAKFVLNVKFRNQWGSTPAPVVKAIAAPAGTIDYLTKSITPGTVSEQVLSATTATSGYNATYTSLFIPQAGVRTVTFTIDGQTLIYTHPSDLPVVAGKVTTLSVLVGKDKISLIDNTVSDWSEGSVNPNMDPDSDIFTDATRPLTVKATENNTVITFTNKSQDIVTWYTSDGRSGVCPANGGQASVTLKNGERVWFVGNENNNSHSDGSLEKSSHLSTNKQCEIYGNVMSLLNWDYKSLSTLSAPNTFAHLFNGESNLKNNPSESLLLPATTLTEGCYKGMFSGCTGLSQLTIDAADITPTDCLAGWLEGIPGDGFKLATTNPMIWKMGADFPWGTTLYTSDEGGIVPVYTAPTEKTGTITYNTSPQTLIIPGTSHKSGVVLEYSTDGGSTWNTTTPTFTNAGNYLVYCRVQGGGVTSEAIPVTIEPKTVTGPVITIESSSYTYDGSAKTPAVTSVKDVTTTIPTSEYTVSYANNTNAGTATVTISDKSGGNYTVSGSTTFTINKAANTVTLNPTSLSFTSSDGVNSTKNVTVTRSGNGTVTASSSNTNLVTVSVSGTTVTVKRVSSSNGSATITVNVAEGTNYLAASKTLSVSVAALSVLLKDAAVGYPVASDGYAYKNVGDIPNGKDVIGMVAYKSGSNGMIMEHDWAAYDVNYSWPEKTKDDIVADNNNHRFGSVALHTTSTSSTVTKYWFVGTKANYETCGLTDQNGFNTVNTRRLNAGCEDINEYRTYATSDGWEFYGGLAKFWWDYWSSGSHPVTLLISF